MLKNSFAKLAVLAAIGALSQAAMAADGTVNFTGEITDSICSLAPESQLINVPLGKITRTKFQTVGTGLGQADWLIGEDIARPGGIRSMAAPNTFGDPDHYSLRYTGAGDGGGDRDRCRQRRGDPRCRRGAAHKP